MITLFIVDDHHLIREGLKLILNKESTFRVIGEAQTGEEAIQWAQKHDVDVFLMDLNLPNLNGIDTTKKILRYKPESRILMLSIYVKEPIPSQAMTAGAFGFISKDASADDLIFAIKKIVRGQKYLYPAIAEQMALNPFKGIENPFDLLSARELQIAKMIVQGVSTIEIAEQLYLSNKTVNSYRYRLFEKLNISNNVELTRLAMEYHLIQLATI